MKKRENFLQINTCNCRAGCQESNPTHPRTQIHYVRWNIEKMWPLISLKLDKNIKMTTCSLIRKEATSRSLLTRLTSFATTSQSPSLASTSSSSSSSISKSCKTCHYKFYFESNKREANCDKTKMALHNQYTSIKYILY